jgi:hypothetical protein
MRLVGYNNIFTNYVSKPGVFGCDMLTRRNCILGRTTQLYLHIPRDSWSVVTGKLREHMMPWCWKVVYLDKQDGSAPVRVLAFTKGTEKLNPSKKQ